MSAWTSTARPHRRLPASPPPCSSLQRTVTQRGDNTQSCRATISATRRPICPSRHRRRMSLEASAGTKQPDQAAGVAFVDAEVVVWDVDGTLADTTQLGFASTNAVLAAAGHPQITLAQYLHGTRYTTPQRMAFHATGDPSHASGAELGGAFDEHYVRLVSPSTAGFFPGIATLLQDISAAGGRHAVLSNACGEYARQVVKANGFSATMAPVLGADNVPGAKPAPDGLLACCEEAGILPVEGVYVGDSPSDGLAASAAGMRSIGVTWGAHTAEDCAGKFDVLVRSVDELREVLLKC